MKRELSFKKVAKCLLYTDIHSLILIYTTKDNPLKFKLIYLISVFKAEFTIINFFRPLDILRLEIRQTF